MYLRYDWNMKIKLFIFLSVIASSVFAQSNKSQNKHWGIGVKAGDPTGLTVRKYNGNRIVEFNVGTSFRFGYGAYKEEFYDYYQFETGNVIYTGHKQLTPVTVQLRFLKAIPVKGFRNLYFNYGFGGQYRYSKVDYKFHYKVFDKPGTPEWHWEDGSSIADNTDAGIDGVAGVEYKFERIPFTIFGDANVFMELVDDPFMFWGQGGVGARFLF